MLAANDQIVSVVDIDELTAVIHVTEREYGQDPGGPGGRTSPATPTRASPSPGKVVRVAPLVKQTSREARVEIQVANAERLLRPGMFILARIELARHENATVVPDAAIVRARRSAGGLPWRIGKTKKARFVPVGRGIQGGAPGARSSSRRWTGR